MVTLDFVIDVCVRLCVLYVCTSRMRVLMFWYQVARYRRRRCRRRAAYYRSAGVLLA